MEGRTRGRLSGALGATLLAAAFVIAVALPSARGRAGVGVTQQRGKFALLSGTPQILSEAWTSGSHSGRTTLTIRQFRIGTTTPIRNYAIEMQKLIHLIVVRDDFASFAHVHPAFDPATGTFQQQLMEDRGHGYYIYADTTPEKVGQQVFRFTLEPGGRLGADALPSAVAGASPSTQSANVPPYTVGLARTTLTADRPQRIDVTILERGRPAADLAPYLGAAAHAVFINTQTLAYVHVHPERRGAVPAMDAAPGMGAGMNMSAPGAGPLLQVDAPALPPGTYRLWIEFRGAKGGVYTAPFTLRAR